MKIWRRLKLWSLIFIHSVLRLNKKLLFGIILLLAIILVFSRTSLLDIASNHVSEGMIGTYQTHDLPDGLMRLISKSLVNLDKSGNLVPGLSTWEVNSDGTVFTFKLRPGLKWVD